MTQIQTTTNKQTQPIKESKHSKTYYDLRDCHNRVSVHQGGTRSGKTYSILKILIELCYANANSYLTISIVRKTMPSLRMTVMRDFFEILHDEQLYDESKHNKTENTYRIHTCMIEFFSLDQPEKVRGAKRDILFINEINEFTHEHYFQLNIRTRMKAIVDYNPSMTPDNFVFTKILTRDDAQLYITTYLDNPFLSKGEIKEIELLRDIDTYYWQIYGEGKRARNPAAVFSRVDTYTNNDFMGLRKPKFLAYGLDWGYTNDPTAVVCVYKHENDLYIREIIYQRNMTNDNIAKTLIDAGVKSSDIIIVDSSEPKSRDELRRHNLKCMSARKGRDSINHSIMVLKQHRLFVHEQSTNLLSELTNYKYEIDINGHATNQVVDAYNHTVDALRYVALNTLRKRGRYLLK